MGSHTIYRKRLIGACAVIVGSLFMGGCALPVSVQVASLIADGVSYIATEKTLADHGLSAIMGQDCGVLKGIQRGSLCVAPDEVTTPAIAKAEPPVTARPQIAKPVPVPVAVPVAKAHVSAPVVVVSAAEGQFYVIGSSFSYEDALSLADNYDNLDPTIMVTSRDGRNQFDIVVGPFAPEQQASLHESLVMAGIMEAWTRRIPLAQWRAERFGRS